MTVTIQDLGALGELLGSVAVLVTLVYLALQTRQNTIALGAQADAARIGHLLSFNLSAATSVELQEALLEDRVDAPTANDMRRSAYWTSGLLILQWQFDQARRGLLPGLDESRVADTVRALFATSRSSTPWWERAQSAFSPDFVAWVDEQRAGARDAT